MQTINSFWFLVTSQRLNAPVETPNAVAAVLIRTGLFIMVMTSDVQLSSVELSLTLIARQHDELREMIARFGTEK